MLRTEKNKVFLRLLRTPYPAVTVVTQMARDGLLFAAASPDSDVFFILLHHASKFQSLIILFDTGVGNKQRLINITELANTLTPEFSTSLMVLHAYTGCDSTSAFRGIGKVKPIKTLQKHR